MILDAAAVVAQRAAPTCEFLVVGHDASPVTESAQTLGGIEAEAADIAKRAGLFPVKQCAVALCTVLHQPKPVFADDLADCIHIAGLAKEVNSQNGLCCGGDSGLNAAGVDVVIFIRLDEHRRGAVDGDAHHAGDVCVRADDDLIPRPDTQQPKRHPQRIQPAGKPHAATRSQIGGKRLLKGGYLLAKDVPAAAKHLQRLLLISIGVQLKGPLEVVCGNGNCLRHKARSPSTSNSLSL